jgi:hypothetical protein
MAEKIEHGGTLFALILRKELDPQATTFYTPKDTSLQLGIIKHEKGYVEQPHIHRRSEKLVRDVVESLHVEYGKVEVSFYSEKGEKVDRTILNEGDVALLMNGGHAIRAMETFKAIKIKQGPYRSIEEDKQFLEVKE